MGKVFPKTHAYYDLLLIVHDDLRKRVKTFRLSLDQHEGITLRLEEYLAIVQRLIKKNNALLPKKYQVENRRVEDSAMDVCNLAQTLGFAQVQQENIYIYPVAGKITGTYPYTIFENTPKSVDNTSPRGLLKTEMDNELIEGATIETEYTIKVKNIGEMDYTSQDYYYYGDRGNGSSVVRTSVTQLLDYVDGRLAGTSNVPNINLSIDAFKDGKKDYTISVKSVRGGRESEATSVTYSFRDEVPTTVVPTTVAPTTAAPTTVAPTPDASTPDASTPDTSTSDETTTPKVTTVKPTTAKPTTAKPTVKPTTKKASLKSTKVTKKVSKKLSSKKVKLTFKKVKGAKKYDIQVSTSKKFKKVLYKKTVKKTKVTLSSKKLKGKKKLYVRVKAVGAKKWSKPVKIKIKK